MHNTPKLGAEMKTFSDYVNLQEIAAYDVGTNILGRTSLDDDSEKAITAAIQAFEIIMSKNSSAAVQFLNRMTTTMPELHAILQQHGLDSFRDGDFKTAMRKAATKGRRVISKGLGDVHPDDAKNSDVVATPVADSFHNPIG